MSKPAEILLSTLFSALFAMLMVWVLVNWVTGCGETFPTANGSRIAGECVGFVQLWTFGK
jgi:hypothetical protein